jgi:hypothetical protein
MAKRLTPIERAIAGEKLDARRRYDQRQRDKGFVRVTVTVPAQQVEPIKALVRDLAKRGLGASDFKDQPQGAGEDAERPPAASARTDAPNRSSALPARP